MESEDKIGCYYSRLERALYTIKTTECYFCQLDNYPFESKENIKDRAQFTNVLFTLFLKGAV